MIHLLRASAGAGKTYHLVESYLQHIIYDPERISTTLVLSFTNLSTQELKERICKKLFELSKEKGSTSSYSQHLCEVFSCEKEALQTKIKYAYQKFIYNYDQVGIYTIDEFFNQLIVPFREELGLPASYKLLLEQQELLLHMKEQLLHQSQNNSTLRGKLASILDQNMQSGKSCSLINELNVICRDVLNHIDRASKNIVSSFPHEEAQKSCSNFQSYLSSLAQKGLKAIENQSFRVEDFSWGKRGVLGVFIKLRANKPVDFSTSRISKALLNSASWIPKSSKRAIEQLNIVETTLRPILQQLANYYKENYPTYATWQAIMPLSNFIDIAKFLQEWVEKLPHREKKLTINQIPSKIKQLLSSEVSLIEYRADFYYRTLLIDEFQDLSTSQWEGLLPLIENIEKKGGKITLVGDVKQAIYRWRGGNTNLLLEGVEKTFASRDIEISDLKYNWRSGSNIVSFNNTFFEQSSKVLSAQLKKRNKSKLIDDEKKNNSPTSTTSKIQRAYAQVKQQIPPSNKDKNKGYINISIIPSESRLSNEWKKDAIIKTIKSIEELQNNGFNPRDITLLVRNNCEAQELLKALKSWSKTTSADPRVCYDAVASSALLLAKDPHITLIIDALYYIQDQQDNFFLAKLICSYQILTSSKESYNNLIMSFEDREYMLTQLPKKFLDIIKELYRMPLPIMVLEIIKVFEIEESTSEAHLESFKELVFEESTSMRCSLQTFLLWWEKQGVKRAVSLPKNRGSIQILTIHQAKGLSFPAVIIPFCQWGLDHPPYSRQILWEDCDKKPFDQLSQMPIYYGSALKDSFFQKKYFEEKEATYLEQFNLLYVALTRSESVLYLCLPNVRTTQISDIGSLILSFLHDRDNNYGGRWNEEKDCWEIGEIVKKLNPIRELKVEDKKRKIITNRPISILNRISTSHSEGIWWHEIFSKIKYLDDFEPLIKSLKKQETLLKKEELLIREKWNALLKKDKFRYFFSNHWEVRNESNILLPSGEILRPDRVIISERKAIVIDFKVGKKSTQHHKQVSNYVKNISNIGYEDVQGYLIYIETIDIEKVSFLLS